MAQKRPGGLTALAVLNFVFGGLGALGVLALLAIIGTLDAASEGRLTAEMNKQQGGAALLWISILLTVVYVALLIASGVGYLGLKKFLGRTLGNTYAVIAITATVVTLLGKYAEFNIGTIIGLIYPVLTLILLNTTFKEDLVN